VLHTDALNAATDANGIPDRSAPTRLVVRFCERLRHLPLGVWAELATSEPSARPITAGALKRLHARLDRLPGVNTRVSNRVYELVAVAEEFVPSPTARRMKAAALTAALALLVREQIPDEDFRTLYEPFARTIPVAELENDIPNIRLNPDTDALRA